MVGCKKEEHKDPVKLEEPENVVVSSDYILTWAPVANASGYSIRIGSFVDSVTTTTYDLNKVLLEGSNFIFLEALGDDKNYLDSDASFIQVEYTRYSPEKFKDAVKEIYSDNSVEISDTDIDETIEIIEEALKGTKATKDDALVVLDFIVSFTNAPLFDDSMAALQEFKNIEIGSEDLASFLYNLIDEYLVKEQENGNSTATMLLYVLSGNKKTVVDTIEAVYLYSTEFGDQYTVAVEKYDKSSRTDNDGYIFYKEIVDALFNEKRPAEEDVLEITSAIKYALGMFESADFGTEELQAITDVLNLVESTYEPIMDATYKVLTVITVDQYSVINDAMKVLEDVNENGLSWDNRHEVELSIKALIEVLGEIELDITKEEAEIKAAWEVFENSSALPYLESLINDLLDSIEGGSEIKAILDIIFGNSEETIEIAGIIKSMLEFIEIPAELQTVVDEILSIIEAYEKAPTTEQELINSILDKLTNDQSIKDTIKKSGYEDLINDVVDVLRTYDGKTVTSDDVLDLVIDTVLSDESLKADIKAEIDTNIPEAELSEIKADIETAITALDTTLSDNTVTIDEMITVLETVSEINFSGIIPEDADLTVEIPIEQIELIYDILVYYQGILA